MNSVTIKVGDDGSAPVTLWPGDCLTAMPSADSGTAQFNGPVVIVMPETWQELLQRADANRAAQPWWKRLVRR